MKTLFSVVKLRAEGVRILIGAATLTLCTAAGADSSTSESEQEGKTNEITVEATEDELPCFLQWVAYYRCLLNGDEICEMPTCEEVGPEDHAEAMIYAYMYYAVDNQ